MTAPDLDALDALCGDEGLCATDARRLIAELRAHRAREERLRPLVDSTPDPIADLDEVYATCNYGHAGCYEAGVAPCRACVSNRLVGEIRAARALVATLAMFVDAPERVRAALDHVAHCDRFDWYASKPKSPKVTLAMGWLESRGLLESGQCVAVDGDGHSIQPERWGIGWRFTDAGRAAWRAIETARKVAEERRSASEEPKR